MGRSLRSLMTIALVGAVAIVPCVAPAAQAHVLQVLPPGGASLDLGTGEQPRLVHVTLVRPGDTLDARIATDVRITQRLTLLVPVASPEGDAPRAELPEAVRIVGAEREAFTLIDERRRWVDETTGVAYRAVGRLELERRPAAVQPRTRSVVRVTRGELPTRAVLLVGEGDPGSFAADDVVATPRALLSLRAWAQTSAEGSRSARAGRGERGSGMGGLVWIPVAVGALSLLLAAWWLSSGRRRSRERGSERAAGRR